MQLVLLALATGRGQTRKNRLAFCATLRFLVVIFHFIFLSLSLYLYFSFSLSAAVAIFIALATIEEKYWNRSRAVTFREMRSGSSGGDWLSTLKLHKHSCIVPERRRNEWIKDTLARGVLAWEIAKPRCFVVAISDWKKHVHIYDSVENCVS